MKVCVSSEGKTLESKVDPRFGRCAYFVFVDTESMESEAVENPNLSAAGGAGVQSGQLVAWQGARAVLTGNVGPNAFQTLQAAGLEIITGVAGTVREAVEKYGRGELKAAAGPSVDSKFGVKGN